MLKQKQSDARALFEALHQIPELAMQEYKTAALIAGKAKSFGYTVTENVGETGVIALLDSGREGPAVAIRADMDALSYQIGGKLECRHTCGHDAHSAMLLAAAKTIAEKKIRVGKFIALFQPGEEPILGALAMIRSGALDSLGIGELYGIHLRPRGEMDVGKLTPALLHSASGRLRVRLFGNPAAAARPERVINAAEAAVLAVQAVNTVHMDPTAHYSIKTTHLNVYAPSPARVPSEAELIVDLKHQDTESYGALKTKAIRAVTAAAAALGARVEIENINYVPGAAYDDEAVETARRAICDTLGEAACLPPTPTAGGDDFHYLVRHLGCKAAYLGLGADASPGLHHQDMTFNSLCLDYGARVLSRIAERRLGFEHAT